MRDPYSVRVLETCALAARDLAVVFEEAARGELPTEVLVELVTMAGEKLAVVTRNVHRREAGGAGMTAHGTNESKGDSNDNA